MEERLSKLLKDGKDWEKIHTSINGVSILKMPEYKGNPPRLGVQINPVGELGRPTKKRGLFLKSLDELEEFRRLLSNDKLSSLMDSIDKICGTIETKKERDEVMEL